MTGLLSPDILFVSARLPGPLSFISLRVLDLVDVLLVSFIIYHIFRLMKGTRAMQMLFGILGLVALAVLADLYQLPGTSWILGSVKSVWVVAFVILFQPEIRNALTHLGRNRFFGIFLKGEARAVDQVAQACDALSDRGFGAIVVFEKKDGLKNYIETGVELTARINQQLLVALFIPGGPLHDGAVIVRGDTVVAAGCTLPISQDQALAATYGMRHRAAVGITEETDAVVVVVSEESQRISLATYGSLRPVDDINDLKKKLSRALHVKAKPGRAAMPDNLELSNQ